MLFGKNSAVVIDGKIARACDSCMKKSARWYCAADDGFLCENCDSSVHSANAFARRHERIRVTSEKFLHTCDSSDIIKNTVHVTSHNSVPVLSPDMKLLTEVVPVWHRGIKRKPRTPRGMAAGVRNSVRIVPEFREDEILQHNEEQILYRVPIYDQNEENFDGFLPSDLNLEKFATNVEILLGKGFDNDSYNMEILGVLDYKEESMEIEAQPFDLNFDYDSPMTAMKINGGDEIDGGNKKGILLRLDYESVISAWSSHGSPWTTGLRPEFDMEKYWPHHMVCA